MIPTKQIYRQDPHPWCDKEGDVGTVDLEYHDMGGGGFIVLNANEWAMSSVEDIHQLADSLILFLVETEHGIEEEKMQALVDDNAPDAEYLSERANSEGMIND